MSKVHAVLLVPAEGDPLGLLKEGPCGARPPRAWRDTRAEGGPRWRSWLDSINRRGARAAGSRALVLAWDGEPVAEGCDRFARAAEWQPPCDDWVEDMLSGDGDPKAADGLGTLILLDADSREIGGEW